MSGETMANRPMYNPHFLRNAVYALDAVAVAAGLTSWWDVLPHIATVLSILWLAIQLGTWVVTKALPWVRTTFFKKETK
jgi:hypothetical protein